MLNFHVTKITFLEVSLSKFLDIDSDSDESLVTTREVTAVAGEVEDAPLMLECGLWSGASPPTTYCSIKNKLLPITQQLIILSSKQKHSTRNVFIAFRHNSCNHYPFTNMQKEGIRVQTSSYLLSRKCEEDSFVSMLSKYCM